MKVLRVWDNYGTMAVKGVDCYEPVYITKNGYGDMVIMSMKVYEEKMFMADVYSRLAEAEADIRSGRVSDAREGLTALREKYGL